MTDQKDRTTFSRIWPAILVAGTLTTLGTSLVPAQNAATQNPPTSETEAAGPRTDGQIEMDVVHSLDAETALKQDWITAGTVQGEVTLSGTSASEANRKLAESIAGKVAGVARVVNNLKVGDPQQAEDASSAAEPQGNYPDPGQGQTPNQPATASNSVNDNGSQQSSASGPPPADTQIAPQDQSERRPNYRPAPAHPLQPRFPDAPFTPVTISQGALLKVRTAEPLDSKRAVDGAPVEFTVVRDVYAAGVLAIPRGATIRGQVTDVKKSGALGGRPELALRLDTLELGGRNYPLDSDGFSVKGPNKAGRTAGNAIGGALLGAIIGGAVGGGSGAAIGAGAGAAGGTAVSAATPGPNVWIPAEALMDFHLNTELTVTPVSAQEAQRLATNAPSPRTDRPTLYRRGRYGYPPPPPPPGYY